MNRGYVGQDYIPGDRRQAGQVEFEHTISGILRDGEDKGEINKVPLIHDHKGYFPLIGKRV